MRSSLPTSRLSEVADINPRLPESLADDEVVSFLPMSVVVAERGNAVDMETRYFREVNRGYTPFRDGDVLVAKITPCFENGKIAQARLTRPYGFGSTEFHVLRSHGERLDARYLTHFLRQPYIRRQGERRMTGSAGQRRVPEHYLAELTIPLPPLPEQQRIAAILDKVDALRAQRRAAIAQLDVLTQSIFLDMFGDPVTNPKRWPKKALAKLGCVITGNTPPRSDAGNYGDAIEWIKSDNINTPDYYLTPAEEYLSEAGKTKARTAGAGSILVTCIAGSPDCIGNAAMADREVAFNQQINAFVPASGNPHFYYVQILVGKRLIREASTGGMKGIVTKGRFEQITLMDPPASLQHEFAERMAVLEKLKALNCSAIAAFDALFASLQHRAFRGEL